MEEPVDEAELERRKKEKKERAVREREEKVRAERQRMEANIARSRQGLTLEEGETQFKCAFLGSFCRGLARRST